MQENLYFEFPMSVKDIVDRKGYTLIRELGKGGEATVYLVTSKKFNEYFVLKHISNGQNAADQFHLTDENPIQNPNQFQVNNNKKIPNNNNNPKKLSENDTDEVKYCPTDEKLREMQQNSFEILNKNENKENEKKKSKYHLYESCSDIYNDNEMKYKKKCLNRNELESLKALNHVHIISLYDYEITDDSIYLFLEYCPHGSLMDYVMNHGPLSGKNLIGVCKTILETLCYCHKKMIAHSDIKPSNMLIDRYGRIKLADFGLSKSYQNMDEKVSSQKIGSVSFMAPELFSNELTFDPFFADVWAVGVTFYMIATGEKPWSGSNFFSQKKAIEVGNVNYPKNMSHSFRQMIGMTLNPSATKRPSVQALLALPIFQGINEKMGFVKISLGGNLFFNKNLNNSSNNNNIDNINSNNNISSNMNNANNSDYLNKMNFNNNLNGSMNNVCNFESSDRSSNVSQPIGQTMMTLHRSSFIERQNGSTSNIAIGRTGSLPTNFLKSMRLSQKTLKVTTARNQAMLKQAAYMTFYE